MSLSPPDSSADDLHALLVKFEREWAARAPEAAATLRPPATDDEIERALTRLNPPAPVPDDARALWHWHNGQGGTSNDFVGGMYFYGLDDVERLYSGALQAQADVVVEQPDLYRPEWVPLVDVKQASAVIDCRTGEVLLHSFLDERIILGRQPSLGALVQLWIRAIREGAWLFPEAGVRAYPDYDESVRTAIADSADDLVFI